MLLPAIAMFYAVFGLRVAYVILDNRYPEVWRGYSFGDLALAYLVSDNKLKRAQAQVYIVVAALCVGFAWPLHVIVLAWDQVSRVSEQRFKATMSFYAITWLAQPLCVLLVLATALLSRWHAHHIDPTAYAIAIGLLTYSTFYQIKLLLSLQTAKNEVMRSCWDPRVLTVAMALIQVGSLSVAYASIDGSATSFSSALISVARQLVSPESLFDFIKKGGDGFTKEALIAASGALLAASILSSAFKFWTLSRADEDIVWVATHELFMHRFKEAADRLHRVKVRTLDSEFRYAVALLGSSKCSEAVQRAHVGLSMLKKRTVPEIQGAALLLSMQVVFEVPWTAMIALLECCMASPPMDFKLYDSLQYLSDSEQRDSVEKLLREHSTRGDEYRLALAWFLYYRDKFAESYVIVSNIDCSASNFVPVARAIQLDLKIKAGTCHTIHSEWWSTPLQLSPAETFDLLCQQSLTKLGTACDSASTNEELMFFVLQTEQLASIGNIVQASSRFHVLALHSRLEERFRLEASASASDEIELFRRITKQTVLR